MKTLDYLFDADYLKKWAFARDAAQYYGITKEGKIVYHEDKNWNRQELSYPKYIFGKTYEKLILKETHEG